MKKIVFIVITLLIVISCDNDENNDFQPTQMEFIEIGKGTLSGSGMENILQSNQIITNLVEWENLMEQIDLINNVTDSFTETEIDFENNILIAVFLSVKPNGWEVEIDSIIENENSINISTQETEYATLALTQPFHIIKISITEKTILFE